MKFAPQTCTCALLITILLKSFNQKKFNAELFVGKHSASVNDLMSLLSALYFSYIFFRYISSSFAFQNPKPYVSFFFW
jgi:hypothetical protein